LFSLPLADQIVCDNGSGLRRMFTVAACVGGVWVWIFVLLCVFFVSHVDFPIAVYSGYFLCGMKLRSLGFFFLCRFELFRSVAF